jgi:hypothetical protein
MLGSFRPFAIVAPVPAAADFLDIPKALPINTLANHGVAQTLNIILTGNKTFVIA